MWAFNAISYFYKKNKPCIIEIKNFLNFYLRSYLLIENNIKNSRGYFMLTDFVSTC